MAEMTTAPSPQPQHLLVPLQHQDELSALGHHGHLCPRRRRLLQGKKKRNGVRKGLGAARTVCTCLCYCRTYCKTEQGAAGQGWASVGMQG